MSLLTVRNLTKTFAPVGKQKVQAVNSVSLNLEEHSTLGLVGESGSGKSTLLRCIFRLERPDSGEVLYDDVDVLHAKGAALRRFRREVQLIFQDPYSSLNPRMTVEKLVSEGMLIHHMAATKKNRREQVAELMTAVGLDPSQMDCYPRTFSGGQRQRIAIARALAVRPRVLVCDEPVSALDVSVQAQVINLLIDMQASLGVTMLFVAHNLAVVRHLCSDVAVMCEGQIIELGRSEQIFERPSHTYTKSLLEAVPIPDPRHRNARAAPIPPVSGSSAESGSRKGTEIAEAK